MIYKCPRCHSQNQLPDTLQLGGEYRCGQCQQILIGMTQGNSDRAVKPSSQSVPRVQRPASANGSRLRIPLWMQWLGKWLRVRSAKQVGRMKKPPMFLVLGHVGYLLVLITLSLSNAMGPEQWWLGSLNLYLPQWIWALPALLLLSLTMRWARSWTAVPLLLLLWVLGPIMGFCWNGAFPAATGTTSLRIMTYNVKWGKHDAHAIAQDVRALHPDILQMQDSEGVLNTELGQALAGWNVRVSGQYIVASRFPLPNLESRDISYAGSDHHCVRYAVQIGSRTVTLYDVHLLSPRNGLESVRHHQIGGMVGNAGARLQEAELLAGYVRQEQGPMILTGDLNAPVQSLVCRQLFDSGLRDAFLEAGLGYGYTYGRYTRIGHPYVRIDHILVSPEWQVQRCWVGNEQGSEHCPVIADLVLR